MSSRLHLQGSNIFFWLTQNQMIKEDHYLACTAKMLEILWCAGLASEETKPTTWIAHSPATSPCGNIPKERAHTLAAYRLFTCQRAIKPDPNQPDLRCRRTDFSES